MKAQPAPIVSGRYFFPNAPVLWLKRIPDWRAISTKWMEESGWRGPGEANRAPGKPCCLSASAMRTSITEAAAKRELSLATKTKNLLPLGICHAAENRRNCRAERSKHLALL